MPEYKSIYDNPNFWRGVRDRLIRTSGQAIVASAAASLFTGAGVVAFLIFLGVALLGSLGTSLAAPEKVLRGEEPETAVLPVAVAVQPGHGRRRRDVETMPNGIETHGGAEI